MRKLFKWFFRLTLAFVALVVLLLVFKDAILKAVVQQRIRAATGMGVSIAKLRVGVLTPSIAVEDFRLYNPAEFGSSKFLDVPELYMEYDPAALLQRTLRIPVLRLNMSELNIVRSGAGRTNLASLPQSAPPAAAAARGAGIKFGGIDTMNLTIGKVTYRDINHPKRDREYISNSKNQVFTNVQTVGDLYGVLTLLWLHSSRSINDAGHTGDRTGGSEGGASVPSPANIHAPLEAPPPVRKTRPQRYAAAWT